MPTPAHELENLDEAFARVLHAYEGAAGTARRAPRLREVRRREVDVCAELATLLGALSGRHPGALRPGA